VVEASFFRRQRPWLCFIRREKYTTGIVDGKATDWKVQIWISRCSVFGVLVLGDGPRMREVQEVQVENRELERTSEVFCPRSQV
jgi:hypothetical protein